MDYRINKNIIKESDFKLLIGEGLIKTVHPDRVGKRIELLSKGTIKYDYIGSFGMGFFNISLPKDKRNEKWVNLIIKTMDNLGYFVSTWFREGDSTFLDVDNIGYNSVYILRFEAKFDTEWIPESRYLYHITSKGFLNKILKTGLVPKSKNKLSKHPDRIYMSINKTSVCDLAEQLDVLGFISFDEQVLLEIDLNNLPIFLRYDGQFDGGVYTTDNIPPSHINVLGNVIHHCF